MNSQVLPAVPSRPALDRGSHWHAQLTLAFRHGARGTRMIRCEHEGPLYVQRPFYPEGPDLAHVYLLHPPGGIVSGDCLHITLQLQSGSAVLCTTPGAGRVYRARADRRLQEQHNLLHVARGASLEWFPQETIIFPGANTRLYSKVQLEPDARFSGWEITVLGLPANNITFDAGQLEQKLQIVVGDHPVLTERLALDADKPALLNAAAGLGAQAVNGIFVCGPFSAAQFAALDMNALQAVTTTLPSRCGITRLGDFLVARFLGNCAQEARRCFVSWWHMLRPVLLQRAAISPAIWST